MIGLGAITIRVYRYEGEKPPPEVTRVALR